MSEDNEKLLRVNVAARRLEKSCRTVWRLIQTGKLTAVREGPRQTLVPEEAVENFKRQL